MSTADIAARLDKLVPARTAPHPPTPDPCQSCGHPAGCLDDCC